MTSVQAASDHESTLSLKELEAEVAKLQQENSKLRKSERELASARNKFADLFDFAPLGYLILTPAGEVIEANLFAAQLAGVKRTRFLGQRLVDFIYENDKHTFETFIKETLKASTTRTCELKLHTRADRVLDVSLQARCVVEINNETRIYLTISDISSRKQIEAALQESHEELRMSEERFRVALQNSSITVFDQDRDLRYTWIYNNILLDSPDDYIGKTDQDLWSPDEAAALMELKQAALDTGKEQRQEIQMIQNGQTLFFDVLIAPRYAPSGEILGIIGVSFDLTNQKETALEMYRQRVLAEALVSAVNAVHGSVNLSEVLDYIMGSMANVIPHDLADIMLLEGDHVRIVRSRGYSQLQLSESVLPIEKPTSEIPLLAEMLTSHSALLIPDLQSYETGQPLISVDWLHAYLGVPLLWQDQVIGFINLMSTRKDFFTNQHSEKLTTFAAQATLAIRNAQLYEEVQQAVVLQERQRLARDLHDAVSQSLYTSSIIAESLQALFETNPDKIPENLEKLCVLNRGALAEMRTLLLELRPEKLDATSMNELLHQLADAARARTEISSEVIVTENGEIPTNLKEALYRIAQEALTNIIKHAKATHVHMRYTNKNGIVKLIVEDDGRGFDVADAAAHRMGISNMQERMAALGGSVEIDSEIDGGTVVTATWTG